MTTAERIDALLKERNWSRRKLAQMAGIPPSTFQSAMERNKSMSVEMLRKIAIPLGVHISKLIPTETLIEVIKYGLVTPYDIAAEIGLPCEMVQGIIDTPENYDPEAVEKITTVAVMLQDELQQQNQREASAIVKRISDRLQQGTNFHKLSNSDAQKAGFLQFNSDVERLIYFFSQLNEEGKRVAADRIQELTEIPKFQLSIEKDEKNKP